MKRIGYVLAVVAAATLVARAEDEQQKPRPERGEGQRRPMMERADKNGDGKISVEEFAAMPAEWAKQRFSHMDKDSDGKVTEAEFNAVREHMANRPAGAPAGHTPPSFADLDTNKDGSLTIEEVTAQATAKALERAKELDKDGDGFISKEERPMRGGPGEGGPGEGGPRHHGPPGDEPPAP